MNRFHLAVALILLSCSLSACQKPDPIRHYVAAQEALAADDDSQAKAALERLTAEAEGELKGAAELARDAADITARREAFAKLSEQVVSGERPKGHVVVFCPMAGRSGASWVQKEGEIQNPYFGATMLHCGFVQEAKK